MLKRVLCILLLIPCLAYANWWHNLWLNNNQQATELLAKKNNILAANTFNDSNWSGIAFYRAHAYESAANKFKLDHSALGYYNLGNSLAFMHKYQEAVDAYKKSLHLQPNSSDAKHNMNLIKQILKQQQKDKNQKDKDKKNQKDKKQNKDDSKSQQQQQQQQQQHGLASTGRALWSSS